MFVLGIVLRHHCGVFFFQAKDGIRDDLVTGSSDVCSSDLDAEAVKLFYGGEAGVNEKVNAAKKAKKAYADNGTDRKSVV